MGSRSEQDIESELRRARKDEKSDEKMSDDEEFQRGQQVVLHEDKEYYPEAAKVFGKEVEAMVEEEDHQPLTQPIIAPPKTRLHVVTSTKLPDTKYSLEYLAQMMSKP